MTENKKKPKLKEVDLHKEQLQMYEQMPEQIMVIKGWTKAELEEEISRLKNLIELSNRGKSNRRKGANYENVVAKKFKEAHNITLVRTPMSGGFQKSSDSEDFKGDINCIDPNIRFLLHLECKKHQRWSVGQWWKQSEEDCPPSKIPMLVMHRFQKIEENKRVETAEDFVMLKLDDFLRIVNKEQIIERKEVVKDESNSKGNSKLLRNSVGSRRNKGETSDSEVNPKHRPTKSRILRKRSNSRS